jgi:outer membrane protein assembly factor BamA
LAFSQSKEKIFIARGLPQFLQFSSQKGNSFANDSLHFLKGCNYILNQLYSQGYLAASFQLSSTRDSVFADFDAGDKYKFKHLKKGNVPDHILKKINFRENRFIDKDFHKNDIANLIAAILNFLENEGYPFSSIKLDSVEISGSFISAALYLDKGVYITFDTVEIHGDVRLKKHFLSHYLQIKPGTPFSQLKVNAIQESINKLNFIELVSAPEVSFQNKEATVHLNLKERNTNRIDGIIGFLPNENEKSKVLFTGQVFLDLQNLFSTGKSIELNWQKVNTHSQALNLSYDHPNVLKSAVDINAGFSLLKEDTTFLNRRTLIAASVRNSPRSTIKVFGDLRASRVFKKEREDIADLDLSSFGFGYEFTTINNYDFPTKGFYFSLESSLGNKFFQSGEIPSKKIQAIQNNSIIRIEGYRSIFKNIVLHNSVYGGTVMSPRLFINDLVRIGGLNSLRGFNENHFFAKDFLLVRNELRFRMDNESFLYLFYDQSYINKSLTDTAKLDMPLGVGAGLTLSTSGGKFNFVYALGKSASQKFNFNYSKIHFGYVSRF